MLPRLRSAVLAASVLCGLAVVSPAQAAVPGLNISAYGDAPVALSKGAKQVRFFVRWSDFEPDAPGDFTAAGGAAKPNIFTQGLAANVARVQAAGATPILSVLEVPAWAASGKRPRDPAEYAAFAGELAGWLAAQRTGGTAPVIEVWNEPDAERFWGETPDPAFYATMLKQSYAAIKANDAAATVLTGPTTGNNFRWIEALYANGAKGSFDGVAVHTDTACSIVGPDTFYREPDGRLGQYTFLAYREVRASMLANGDPKPIWMTELGWGTTGAVCGVGQFAGQKAAGVNEAEQASFLTKAFQCMANDPYVVAGTWFTLRDDLRNAADPNHYGLFRQDGAAKPAMARFGEAGAQGPGPCGDFTPPSLEVLSPVEGQQFVGKLDLRAVARDAGVGVARVSYAFNGGRGIRNYTDGIVDGRTVGLAPWQGSGALALGAHTVEVSALDRNGNVVRRSVRVTKVAAGSLRATLTPAFKLAKRRVVSCRKAGRFTGCSFKGTLARGASGRPSVGGKVAVEWQFKNRQGIFRKLVGGLKPASKAFTFKGTLKRKGTWRVRAVYRGVSPYKAVASRWLAVRVR